MGRVIKLQTLPERGALTLQDLVAEALQELRSNNLPFDAIPLNEGFKRLKGDGAKWIIADSGIGVSGFPWLMVSAGDYRQTGGEHVATVVYKSWDKSDRAVLSPQEQEALQAELQERSRLRQEQDREAAEKARKKANELWTSAKPADPKHPYLQRKKIQPHGIRQRGYRLMIPVCDADGGIMSLQFIATDGGKRFLTGGCTAGGFFTIGDLATAQRCYEEDGYADACVNYEALQESGDSIACVVAFSAGNLPKVARLVRDNHPKLPLTVVADNDPAGIEHATQAATEAGATLVIPHFPDGITGKDLSDLALTCGMDEVRKQLLTPSDPPPQKKAKAKRSGGSKEFQATQLVKIIEQEAILFHDHSGDAEYATIHVNGHQEHWELKSPGLRKWLNRRFWERHGKAPTSEAISAAMGVAAGMAQFDGEEKAVSLRVAGHDGNLYLDLCQADWSVIEITPNGWRIVSAPPVTFIRRKVMAPLPIPGTDGNLSLLWNHLNVVEGDRVLVAAFELQALRDRGPYPLGIIQGEQGSGKTTACKILRDLIDPSFADLRSPPKCEEDLCVAARNGRIIAVDNLSGMPPWLSDAFCRVSTGGTFGTRELYTNREESLLHVYQPVLLNGIDDIATRHDLIDRSIILNLEWIPEDKRKPEANLWREFRHDHAKILGALLDAVVCALHNHETVKLDKLPRMADFAIWAHAAGDTIGKGFLTAYTTCRTEAIERGLEGSSVAKAIRKFMDGLHASQWTGKASDLLQIIDGLADDSAKAEKVWPKNGSSLGKTLKRLSPPLRSVGISIAQVRSGRERTITITKSTDPKDRENAVTPVIPVTDHNKQWFRSDSNESLPSLSCHQPCRHERQ